MECRGRAEPPVNGLHPPQTAENRGCSAETGNSGLAPATRRLSAPAGKFRSRRAQTRHRRWSQKGLAFCCEPNTRGDGRNRLMRIRRDGAIIFDDPERAAEGEWLQPGDDPPAELSSTDAECPYDKAHALHEQEHAEY